MKTLKERENSIKSEEKNLEKQKKEMLANKEELLRITYKAEKERAKNELLLQNLREEPSENGTETEEEHFLLLQVILLTCKGLNMISVLGRLKLVKNNQLMVRAISTVRD